MTSNTTSATATDAAGANQQAGGATPPASEVPSQPSKPMTADEARAVLRKHSKAAEEERDPLLESPEGEDPLLTHEQDSDRDPLGAAIESEWETEENAEEPETDPTETPESAEEAEAEPETEAEEEETPEAEAQPEPEPEHRGRKRLNIFRKKEDGEYVYNAQERAAMQFADEEGIGVIEAYKRLFGDIPKTAEKTLENVEDQAKPEQSVAEIETQIGELRKQRKEAKSAFDVDKEEALTTQIEDLIDAKNEARQREADRGRAAKTKSQEHEQTQQASVDRAAAVFPDSVKEGSELRVAVNAEIARMERANPDFFKDPEWPEAIIPKVAMKLGIAPVTKTSAAKPGVKPAEAAPKPAAQPPTKPKAAARPAPAPGGVSGPTQGNVDAVAQFQRDLAAAKATGDATKVRALMGRARELQGQGGR